MKKIRLIAVGRLKRTYWKEAADHYIQRISHTARLEEIIVKDAPAGLPPPERSAREGEGILKQVRGGDCLICLDEKGKTFDSRGFAAFIGRLFETGNSPCFVIGGAYGLSPDVLAAAPHVLSLGPMTFPHELARVLLLEQVYRAESILAGSGYHH